MGFHAADAARDGTLNQNGQDEELVKAVLCAGMFPNIARISWKGRHGQRVNFQTFEDGQIKLHPSSVNESVKDFEHPWLIYNEKVRTTNLFLRDCSNVPDYALVFFGGAVKRESSSSLSMCRGFYTFSADPQVCELILSLRTQLDGLLQRHIKQPQLDLAVEGHAIVSAIQRLLNPHGRVIRPPDVMRTSDYSDWIVRNATTFSSPAMTSVACVALHVLTTAK